MDGGCSTWNETLQRPIVLNIVVSSSYPRTDQPPRPEIILYKLCDTNTSQHLLVSATEKLNESLGPVTTCVSGTDFRASKKIPTEWSRLDTAKKSAKAAQLVDEWRTALQKKWDTIGSKDTMGLFKTDILTLQDYDAKHPSWMTSYSLISPTEYASDGA
jgi:hypothetical protein